MVLRRDDLGRERPWRVAQTLTNWLLQSLEGLKHGSGVPMVRLYGPGPQASGGLAGRGGTIAFNFLDPAGASVDERAVSRDAEAAGISVRTGCFCNPGAAERAFGLTRKAVGGTFIQRAIMRRAYLRTDMTTVDDYLRVVGLSTGGAVRVSVGLPSTLADIESFLDFAERTYRDRFPDLAGLPPRLNC
jgi:selenocysteine lyase/cysteine desulfurase